MSEIRKRALTGLRAGDEFVVTRSFTENDTCLFGDITRDYNPVHYDPRFAAVKGFPRRILHGLLTGGMICEIGGQIGWLATSMTFNFRRPVYFGDTITCCLTITELDERGRALAQAVMTNQHGEVVVEATLGGQVPGPPEQAVLGFMVREGDPTNKLAGRG
jgi:acyl dehydratase